MVSESYDAGKTWTHTRHLELDRRQSDHATQFAYPSVIEGKNGAIHVVYSLHRRDAKGEPNKTIKYARISEDWIREGD
jgi:predicted neuraminidase